MSWEDKTVSLGKLDKQEFDSELAHVTVSENGIEVEFKDVEDWKRIRREVGEEKILEELRWEELEEVDLTEEHLYYPHIDLGVERDGGEREERVFFTEDEKDVMESCLNAVRKFWNAHRQRSSSGRDTYEYGEAGEESSPGEEVELEEDDEREGETGGDQVEGRENNEEVNGEEDGEEREERKEESGQESVEDVVEEFMQE
ncbi:MAG: hypothetical protein SVQ76_02150 [Candidatus Nanohaloarchaea archaeon]|nr:hypothetical protein [Candidatus Nanohaloarchaea archaeon]